MATERSAYKRLTLMQRKFVDAYLGEANGNATLAAEIAGYEHAYQAGYKLLRQTRVVRDALEERMAEALMSANEAMYHLSDMARAEASSTVRVRALELVGRYHGLFVDRHEVEVRDEGAVTSLNRKLTGLAARLGTSSVPGEPDGSGSEGT